MDKSRLFTVERSCDACDAEEWLFDYHAQRNVRCDECFEGKKDYLVSEGELTDEERAEHLQFLSTPVRAVPGMAELAVEYERQIGRITPYPGISVIDIMKTSADLSPLSMSKGSDTATVRPGRKL